MHLRRSLFYPGVGFALIAAAVIALLVGTNEASASANDGAFTPHPTLVPTTPANSYPIILDTPLITPGRGRQTLAVDLIDGYIISGGDFLNIELRNGQVVNQPYLAIFDTDTKDLVCTDLDVDDEVWAIAPGPKDNTAIIGGRFDKVTGPDGVQRTRNKVAMINLETCAVNKSWIVPSLNGKVTELAVSGDRLFIGGDFTSTGGNFGFGKLIEVNHDTAAHNTAFAFTFGGALSRTIVGLDANDAGTRLGIVHRATSINGVSMRGTAIINIANPGSPSLTAHRMATNITAFSRYEKIQDGAIAPDFSGFAIAMGPATEADFVYFINSGEAPNQFRWEKYMRDTTFGVAISNNAVYAVGHFCFIDSGPGATQTMSANGGPGSCTGVFLDNNPVTGQPLPPGAFRTQIAALSLTDGTPLTWNPGNNALRGGTALTVVDRGLLVGYDGVRTNDTRVGTTAFFDFGAPDDPRASQTCTATVNALGEVALSWTAVDGITDYVVRRNSSWIASPGNALSYVDAPPAGTHTYRIRTFLDGEQWDTTCNPTVTVNPATQTCTATLNADKTVTVTWTAIAGEDSYSLRRNGSWVATTSGLTVTDDPGVGVHTYVIRSKRNGIQTNTTCNPTITITNPGAGQTCTATVNANGSVTLNWSAIPGEDTYVVRKNGGWLASPGNVLTFTDTTASPGDSFSIRSREGGVTKNTSCV